jgi:hypothetical protein
MIRSFRLYVLNIMVAVDQLVNAMLLGDPDETISSRVGKGARSNIALSAFEFLIDLMFLPIEGEWNHCKRHIEIDEGKNEVL